MIGVATRVAPPPGLRRTDAAPRRGIDVAVGDPWAEGSDHTGERAASVVARRMAPESLHGLDEHVDGDFGVQEGGDPLAHVLRRHAAVRVADGLLERERDFADAAGGAADPLRAPRAPSPGFGVDRDLLEKQQHARREGSKHGLPHALDVLAHDPEMHDVRDRAAEEDRAEHARELARLRADVEGEEIPDEREQPDGRAARPELSRVHDDEGERAQDDDGEPGELRHQRGEDDRDGGGAEAEDEGEALLGEAWIADRRARHHRDLAADDGEEDGVAVRAAEGEKDQRRGGERDGGAQRGARREAAGVGGGEAIANGRDERSGLGLQGHRVVIRVSRAAARVGSAEPVQEDPVAHARRIGAPRRLEGEPLSIRRDGRVRRLVAVPVAPARHAHELGAVRREGELPEIDVPRVLPVRALIAARLDERPRAVGGHALHLVVLAGQLAIGRDLPRRDVEAHHVGLVVLAVAHVDQLAVVVAEVLRLEGAVGALRAQQLADVRQPRVPVAS